MISTIINGLLMITLLAILVFIAIAGHEFSALKKELEKVVDEAVDEAVDETLQELTDKDVELLEAIAEVLSYDGNIKKEGDPR